MNALTVQHTRLFDKTVDTEKKFIVHQGGTRSSKTFSILQYLIFWVALCQDCASTVSIVRKSFPSMKSSVMRDFFEILKAHDLYDPACHNRTDNTYILRNTLFEFFSMDIAEKKKGSKRDYLFVDEANELSWEDFFQLMIRTSKKVLLSYKPSFNKNWIYDKVV
jgi:phage terminase large subunit